MTRRAAGRLPRSCDQPGFPPARWESTITLLLSRLWYAEPFPREHADQGLESRMKIIRYADPTGQIHYGCVGPEESAFEIAGDIFGPFAVTDPPGTRRQAARPDRTDGDSVHRPELPPSTPKKGKRRFRSTRCCS